MDSIEISTNNINKQDKSVNYDKIRDNVGRLIDNDLVAIHKKLPKPLESNYVNIWSERIPKGQIYILQEQKENNEVVVNSGIGLTKSIKSWSCFHFICY